MILLLGSCPLTDATTSSGVLGRFSKLFTLLGETADLLERVDVASWRSCHIHGLTIIFYISSSMEGFFS